MQQLKTKKGFTLVEVSLAFLFISLISITVALVINSIVSIYNKGLSLKAINSTGSDLIEEFSTNLSAAPATQLSALCDSAFSNTGQLNACKNDTAQRFILVEHEEEVRLTDQTADEARKVQISGAFCTGKYSYVWNSGYINNPIYVKKDGSDIPSFSLTYKVSTSGGSSTSKTKSDFRLLRVEDPSRVVCGSQLTKYGNPTNPASPLDSNEYSLNTSATTYDITKDAAANEYVIASDPVELIVANENPLAVYNFYVAPPAQDSTTNRLFYSGSFVLATLAGGVNLTTISDYCQLSGVGEDFDYCAINKFNFAAEATGK